MHGHTNISSASSLQRSSDRFAFLICSIFDWIILSVQCVAGIQAEWLSISGVTEWSNVMLRSYSPMEAVKDFGCLVNRLPTGRSHGCASHKISFGSSYSGIREGSTFSDWPTEIITDYNLSFSKVIYLHQAFPLVMKIWQNRDPSFLLSQFKIYAQARYSILNAPRSYLHKGRIATQSSESSLRSYLDTGPSVYTVWIPCP